jgi:hypothetical protein
MKELKYEVCNNKNNKQQRRSYVCQNLRMYESRSQVYMI